MCCSAPKDTIHTDYNRVGFSSAIKKHWPACSQLVSIRSNTSFYTQPSHIRIPAVYSLQRDTSCLTLTVSCEQFISPTRLQLLTFLEKSWAPLKILSKIQTLSPRKKKRKTCTNTCNFVSSFRIRGCPEVHSQPFKECSFHTDNICLVYHGAQKIIIVPDTQKHNKCLFELSDWTLEGSGLQVSFRAISVASERS